MKQKTIHCLLTFVWLAIGYAGWAQTPQLEIADRYGDKQTVTLSDGMTLYWPQGFANLEKRPGAFGVLCDKSGQPVFSFPINSEDFGYVKFLNAPASSQAANMEGFQGPTGINYPLPLRYDIGGKSYWMAEPGEMRFSSPLGTYELITADGQHFTIPMADTQLIHYQDTIQGINGYLSRMAEGSDIYFWAFYNGKDPSTNKLYEDFYAMIPDGTNNIFSLLMPSDEALSFVPYVISITSQHPSAFRLEYMDRQNPPIRSGKILYPYNFETGEVGESPFSLIQLSVLQIAKYLSNLLHSHTILHNRYEDWGGGLNSGNEYYLALDGSPIRVIREGGKVTGVQSAFHLWNEQKGVTTLTAADGYKKSLVRANITAQRQKGNGTIYCIDNTLEATPRSVYSVLSGSELGEDEENPFQLFFDLCNAATTSDTKTRVFINNGDINNPQGLGLDFVGQVPFTLYVPTNEAILQEAALNGLPYPDEIEELQGLLADTEDETTKQELSASLQEKLEQITDFVKAHIQLGIEIADQLPFERDHNTVLVDKESLVTPRLYVRGLGNGQMTVTDARGNTRHVVDAHKNIFVREAHCIYDTSGTGNGSFISPFNRFEMTNIVVGSYANGVIHQIDGVLRYK